MKHNKYWFRKRRGLFTSDLGWGYTPITWEGWGNLAIFVLLVFSFVSYFGVFEKPVETSNMIEFLVCLFILIVLFALFADRKTNKKKNK
ncbi:hypothetical protein HN587_00350 [Candidatus Woesearchaeota archaeon]|jgi:hypothetical protein|nr:hypothetical protein [Candidatus Woesearchaeota archaeon]